MESAGLHIIMDAYVRDPAVFTRESIGGLFGKLTEALGMSALDKPMIYEVPVDPSVLERVRETGNFEDEGGITGVQVISTSHLSIHAWPLQRFLSLDAFSCKDFDSDLALGIIREALGVVSDSTHVLARFKPPARSFPGVWL